MSTAPARQRSWFGRHWKWLIPTLIVVPLLLLGGLIAGILFLVVGVIKNADVYQQAMTRARSDAAVIAALGEPVEDGFMPSGQINTSGPIGDADLAISLSGPRGEGTLYVVATKTAGQWGFERLELDVEGKPQRIDLLQRSRPQALAIP